MKNYLLAIVCLFSLASVSKAENLPMGIPALKVGDYEFVDIMGSSFNYIDFKSAYKKDGWIYFKLLQSIEQPIIVDDGFKWHSMTSVIKFNCTNYVQILLDGDFYDEPLAKGNKVNLLQLINSNKYPEINGILNPMQIPRELYEEFYWKTLCLNRKQ